MNDHPENYPGSVIEKTPRARDLRLSELQSRVSALEETVSLLKEKFSFLHEFVLIASEQRNRKPPP